MGIIKYNSSERVFSCVCVCVREKDKQLSRELANKTGFAPAANMIFFGEKLETIFRLSLTDPRFLWSDKRELLEFLSHLACCGEI